MSEYPNRLSENPYQLVIYCPKIHYVMHATSICNLSENPRKLAIDCPKIYYILYATCLKVLTNLLYAVRKSII